MDSTKPVDSTKPAEESAREPRPATEEPPFLSPAELRKRMGTRRRLGPAPEAAPEAPREEAAPPEARRPAAARCPYCHDGFAELVVTRCWACHTQHHSRCVIEYGGCSVFGCEGGPKKAGTRPRVVFGRVRNETQELSAERNAERAELWRERERRTIRINGAVFGVAAVFAIVLGLSLRLGGFGDVVVAAAALFLLLCLKDVLFPDPEGVGWALAVLRTVFASEDRGWTWFDDDRFDR